MIKLNKLISVSYSRDSTKTYDYLSDLDVEVGDVVVIMIREKEKRAIVREVSHMIPLNLAYELKSITRVCDKEEADEWLAGH